MCIYMHMTAKHDKRKFLSLFLQEIHLHQFCKFVMLVNKRTLTEYLLIIKLSYSEVKSRKHRGIFEEHSPVK